jgi:hypothetical protein
MSSARRWTRRAGQALEDRLFGEAGLVCGPGHLLAELAARGDQLPQGLGRLVTLGQAARQGGGEASDDRRVDLVVLGHHAAGLGELAHPYGIDPAGREPGVQQGPEQASFVAAAGLEADALHVPQLFQPSHQRAPTRPVIGEPRGLAGRPDRHVQPVLRHVHADKHVILRHLRPCLAVRGRTLATVRVWKTVRSTKLPHVMHQGGRGLPDAAGGPGQRTARNSQTAPVRRYKVDRPEGPRRRGRTFR